MEENNNDIDRLERKVDKLTRLTKENNRMLRSERAMRHMKTFVFLCVTLFVSGFGYYLYTEYKETVIEIRDKTTILISEVKNTIDAFDKLKETIN